MTMDTLDQKRSQIQLEINAKKEKVLAQLAEEYPLAQIEPSQTHKVGEYVQQRLTYITKKNEIEMQAIKEFSERNSEILNEYHGNVMDLFDRASNEDIARLSPTSNVDQMMEVLSQSFHPITYITIKYNAGYGNFLSICGSGPNMSWDSNKAIPLRCVREDTWVYETSTPFQSFDYKILLNNTTWEKLSYNRSLQKNNPCEITPYFF